MTFPSLRWSEHAARIWFREGLLHLAIIGVFIILPNLLAPKPHPFNPFSRFWTLNLLNLVWFYFHLYLFIPRWVVTKKMVWYGGALIGGLVVYSLAHQSLLELIRVQMLPELTNDQAYRMRKMTERTSAMAIVFPFLFSMFASLALHFMRAWYQREELDKARAAERMSAELAFLRSQISPHFLFNVLNQIVALSRKQPELVEPTVIRLSNLMRYMLYEANQALAPISKEIEYLQSYIALQQMRFRDQLKVDFEVKGDLHLWEIAPLLLIPFVENAFKHGTGLIQDPFIWVHLDLNKDLLTFAVENQYQPSLSNAKDETSGIGLENVRRRLTLLYPDRHALRIHTENGRFKVQLQIARSA